jgi:hypothetical protein
MALTAGKIMRMTIIEDTISLAAMADALSRWADYRVLRRLVPRLPVTAYADQNTKAAILLDMVAPQQRRKLWSRLKPAGTAIRPFQTRESAETLPLIEQGCGRRVTGKRGTAPRGSFPYFRRFRETASLPIRGFAYWRHPVRW